jgi:hypothetical protein
VSVGQRNLILSHFLLDRDTGTEKDLMYWMARKIAAYKTPDWDLAPQVIGVRCDSAFSYNHTIAAVKSDARAPAKMNADI